MLSNFQLEDLCRYYGVPLNNVVMKNELPTDFTEGNFIINLESAPLGGSHWVSLRVDGNNAMYFDSFAGPPVQEAVEMVKEKHGTHLGFNNAVIQDYKSSNCGYYAFAFLFYTTKSKLPIYKAGKEFIERFQPNTLKNDHILAETLVELAKTSGKPINRLLKRLCKERIVRIM
jgi:hypothetical protein